MHQPTARIVLPSGLWADGAHHRVAWIRTLTGRDELDVAESGASDGERISALLAACTTRLGTVPDPPLALLDALPLGDREALLLGLRAHSYGPALDATTDCPHCGTRLDLELGTGQLLLEPYPDPQPDYTVRLDDWRVRFRLPTAADLGAVGDGGQDGEATLVGRCVLEAADSEGLAAPVLPAGLAEAVGTAMLEHDPQAELALRLRCAGCGQDFSSVLDTAGYLLRDIGNRAGTLYAQIHTLALYYHWGEAEILDLPQARRMLYLDLLDEPAVSP